LLFITYPFVYHNDSPYWQQTTQQYYSDKLTLSFDVFCREKPKSECLVPSRHPDFVGMMRPGHDQSTPFGLTAAGRAVFNAKAQRRRDATQTFWSAAGSEAPRRFGSSVRSRKAVSPLRSATAVQNPRNAR
jgi:hypothetical protein